MFAACLLGGLSLFTACGGVEEADLQTTTDDVRNGDNDRAQPWMVSLQAFNGSEWVHFCGGTLIRNRSVLSAAHCVEGINRLGIPLSRLRACVGARNISRNCNAARTSAIARMNSHPNYASTPTGSVSDIAVFRLREAFPDNTKIVLARSNQLPGNNQNVTLKGWGRTESGFSATILQTLTYRSLGRPACRNRWAAGGVNIRNSHLCTRATSEEGACNGDSGGVLRFRGRQVGVVSFGSLGCTGTFPDVYTNVASFRDWALRCANQPNTCNRP